MNEEDDAISDTTLDDDYCKDKKAGNSLEEVNLFIPKSLNSSQVNLPPAGKSVPSNGSVTLKNALSNQDSESAKGILSQIFSKKKQVGKEAEENLLPENKPSLNDKAHIAQVQSIFKSKQIRVILLCNLIMTVSQYDFSAGHQQILLLNKTTPQDQEEEEIVKRVVHLTTAIFLILMGSLLEYTSNIDFYVLMIGVGIGFAKVFDGATIYWFGYQIKHSDPEAVREVFEYIPFELVYAVADSIKYIQVIYIAKWTNKKNLMFFVGLWFVFFNLLELLDSLVFVKIKSETFVFKFEGCEQIVTGALLVVLSLIQYSISTMDPLDSGFIINEQLMNISTIFELPKEQHVIIKDEFMKSMKERRRTTNEQSNKTKQREIRMSEEVEMVLRRSQSVSFNTLMEVRHVKNLLITVVAITVAYMISKRNGLGILQASKDTDLILSSSFFVGFLGGIYQSLAGLIAITALFRGKRMTLIMLCLIFLLIVDLAWAICSNITDIEQAKHSTASLSDMGTVDKVLFFLQGTTCEAVYYIIIISSPIDICNIFALKEGKRIFALLVCFIGGIKLGMEGLVFDKYVSDVLNENFTYQRIMTIFLELFTILGFFPMVSDEHSRSSWIQKPKPSRSFTEKADRANSFGMVENSEKLMEDDQKLSYFSFQKDAL